MSQAPAVAFAAVHETNLVGAATSPPGKAETVSLRGTTRGLEILVSGTPSTAALGARLTELFAEAPAFFAGSSARVAIDGALPSGALACLEEVATRFQVQIVEIGPVAVRRRRSHVPAVLRPDDVPQANLAEGTGPIADEAAEPRVQEPGSAGAVLPVLPGDAAPGDATPVGCSTSELAPSQLASADAAPADVELASIAPISAAAMTIASTHVAPAHVAPAAPARTEVIAVQLASVAIAAAPQGAAPHGPRLVIGPVRSGMIVDHTGHVIVIGDVNPGAEVRAEGSIIVLGRLRGVAHAAIGRDAGCIVALSLQPQQLRIGRMVARAADADRPSGGAEIAYATGETIVVERFLGRLPSGLAASM
jgi:septum site-determining protein MinC